jgi:hypothetical protein
MPFIHDVYIQLGCQRDIAPVRVLTALATLQSHSTHTRRRRDNTRWCTASVLHASSPPPCTAYALHAPHSHALPASLLAAYRVTSTRRLKLNKRFSRAGHVGVQRVVDGEVDLRRTSTSEFACDAGTSGTLSAQRRSGQVRRTGTPSMLMVIGHVAASATESWFYPAQSRPRSTFRLGSRWLDDTRHPTMWLRHAADGRPCPELGKTSDLRLIVWNPQILLT